MFELTPDQKFWLNVLSGLDKDVKHEVASTFNACVGKSAMHKELHPKYAQYVNCIGAINNLLQAKQKQIRKPRWPHVT